MRRLFSPRGCVLRSCAPRSLQCSVLPKLCPLQTSRSWARRGMLLLASRELCPLRSRCNPCWSTTSCSRCGVQPRLTASSLVAAGEPGFARDLLLTSSRRLRIQLNLSRLRKCVQWAGCIACWHKRARERLYAPGGLGFAAAQAEFHALA